MTCILIMIVYYVRFYPGILFFGNNRIERNLLWNDGQLITLNIIDRNE